ncbi:MAG: twin-arginine translocase TatA/TatE family subunit, partial [Atopobiaceae bacterium]|nr:twin-arginine translocase TatA/TatE family subunit [Atopobiaceae bacterium]
MFGIGETELLIIVAFAFMIFGPDKLPGMGRTLGRALRQFRQAQEGFTEVVQAEVMDPLQDAMNDPLASGTRSQRRAAAEERAAALAQDADIDAGEASATATHKETFAERKARLEAERAAREEQQTAQAEPAGDEPAAQDEPAQAVEDAPQQEPATPDTSASALYAMGGSSSFAASRAQ